MTLPQIKPAIELDAHTYGRGLSCVHCGLCLPACPTYVVTGNEADSPRGRIQLMLGLADGRIEATPAVAHHLDLCLDCRGCETACPSAVVYHELIESVRPQLPLTPAQKTASNRLLGWLFFHVFTHPARLKIALIPARLLQRVGLANAFSNLLPGVFGKMLRMLPADGPLFPKRLPEKSSAPSPRAAVSLLPGCIGSVMFDSVNRKSLDLLLACKAEVRVPRRQVCCGAIHLHNGERETAMSLARQNIEAFSPFPDYIATNIAGCGAMLREYGELLRTDKHYRERAEQFSARVRDMSEVIFELKPPPLTHSVDQTVTYHDACHLAHAQKVTAAPRMLLSRIPGLKLIPLPESDLCCGAAGTYNLTQPEMATALAERKLNNIASTAAAVCVTGNVGCAMHLRSEAARRNQPIRIVHPVELLHQAAFGSAH